MAKPITPLERRQWEEGVQYAVVDCGHDTPCHLWLGHINNWGYGETSIGSKHISAHVAAFIRWCGPVPAGMQVHHECHVRHCVNPGHLSAVTEAQNKADQHRARRLTPEAVREIRASCLPQRRLAVIYGVDQALISRVRRGEAHRRVSHGGR